MKAFQSGSLASQPVDGGDGSVPLPDFDIQPARGTVLPVLPERSTEEATGDIPRGSRVRWSALTRRASRVAHSSRPLTLPSTAEAIEVAKGFLASQPALFGLGRGEVQALQTTRNYTTPGLGVTHLTVAQRYREIPVFQSEMVLNVDRRGRLLSAAGELVPRLEDTINTVAPVLTAAEALAIGARSVGVALARPLAPLGPPVGSRQRITFAAGDTFPLPITVELSYFQVAPGTTRLAWDLTVFQHGVPDIYHLLVDAVTGAVLFRKNYTQYAAQGLVYHRDSPQDGTPYLGGVPPVLARVLRPFDGGMIFNSADPHFDWWAGAPQTNTESNNVKAGLNREGPAFPFLTVQPKLVSAPGGDFSFPLDLSQPPSAWSDAAVTNLFYWNNVCHDVWHHFGFTEIAGNFQKSNFGLGGGEADHVIALAQHGADLAIPERNNAFMATLPDGFPAWMAMFEFDVTSPFRDSDLDNGVIIHEYGHGLSNRLIGNGNGLNGFQSGSMGEGWSDFCALMILAEPTDDIHGIYPMGGWILGDFPNGIRSQPYSANPTVFTKTYADIDLPFPEVHFAGEIMANALWQMYVKLVERYGFTVGRERAMQLFVDALKLSPVNPTFLDYRDAVLLADNQRYGGADLVAIWSAFASRGMGLSASTTDADDIEPVEAFDVPFKLHSISGRVSVNGMGIGGVRVTATNPALITMENPEGIAATEITAADGTYTLPDLEAGSLRVSATFPSFEFAPPDIIVAVPPSATDVNFVGEQAAAIPGPSDLAAAALSSRRIRLEWKEPFSDETAFEIERKVPGGDFTRIAVVEPNTTSYLDSDREPNHTYIYRVRALLPYATTEYSNEASALTFPETPAALTARVLSDTRIELSWVPAPGGQEYFQLERVKGGSIATGSELTNIEVPGDQTTYVDVAVAAYTTYAYRIRAINSTGQSPVSREAGGTTLRPRPAMPSGLTVATLSSSSLRLTWTDESVDETFFRVERSTDDGATWPVTRAVAGVVGTGGEVTYTESGLAANTAYTFRVIAVNVNHGSDPTGEVSRRTAPARPTGLAAAPSGGGAVKLVWSDNSPIPSDFRVERKSGGDMFGLIDTVASGVSTYTDNSVLANTEYIYRVQAVNPDANSEYSNEASVTVPPAAPNAPTALLLEVLSNREIRLSWTDQSLSEQLFKIERWVVGDLAGFRQIATVPAASGTGATVTYTDGGLVPATRYAYRVRAANVGGDSAFTPEREARTLPNRPGVPFGLAVTVVSQSELRLTWTDGSSDEAGFKIERSPDGTTFTQVDTASMNATTYVSSGLAADTRYYYRLRAYNDGGESAYSNIASATTKPNVPSAPIDLNALVSPSGVRLTWTDRSDNEAGIRVERSTNGSDYSLLVLLGADATSHTDPGITPNTPYWYRVRAVNAGGESAPSNAVMVLTPPLPPTAPSDLRVSVVSNSQLQLSWQDNSSNEAAFEVERRAAGGSFNRIATLLPGTTEHTDTDLGSNTEYDYRVRAINTGGGSAYSSSATGLTLPSDPSGLAASATAPTRIDLVWSDRSAQRSAFKVERAVGMSATWSQIAVTAVGASSYQDRNLPAAVQYRYRVRATNASGDSAYATPVSAETLPLSPGAPTQLRVLLSTPTSLTLGWTDQSVNEVGFKVERSDDGGRSFLPVSLVGANVESVKVEGLMPSTTYHFRVRAYNAGGDSAFTSPLAASTLPLPPGAPSALTVIRAPGEQVAPGALAPGATSLVLHWEDNSNSETGFRIERSTNGGESFIPVITVGENETSFADTGLQVATAYTYRVLAVNAGGDSAPSATSTLSTLPAPPTAPAEFTALATSAANVLLTWADRSSNETGFRLERRSGAGTYSVLATVASNTRTHEDATVIAGATYHYRVAASNEGGLSTYAEAQSTLPLGLVSLELRAAAVKGGKPVRGVVTLSGPAPRGGVEVMVESSDVAARVAKKVRILAGRTSATFVIRTVRPREAVAVQISAAYGGVTRSAELQVLR